MVYKLFLEFTTGQTQSIDIREDDTIMGILLVMSSTTVDGQQTDLEVSFISNSSFENNDTNGVLASFRSLGELTTSGAFVACETQYIALSETVAAGERLYLHGAASTGAGTGIAYIYTGKASARPSGRRR